jgi:prepilin-type N-terminal cleavage/methylation domain-containing protein
MASRDKRKPKNLGRPAGMTLIELLLALTILAMVMAGVSTLAFAMASVKNSTDDTSSKQAYIRFAETQLGDMIRQARLVCYASNSQVALWTTDTNGDGLMNV